MRRWSTTTLAILVCSTILFSWRGHGGEEDAASTSARRLALADKLAMQFFTEQPLETTTEKALSALLPMFLEKSPDLPSRPTADPIADADLEAAVEREVNRLAQAHAPTPDQNALYAQAAAQYPIYQPGDKVVVVYRANPRYSTAHEGAYQGRSGAYLKVGTRMIRIADMVGLDNNDVELLKFNPEESERLRQAFVAAEMEKHRLAQAEYKNAQRPEIITRLSTQARQANEKAGYTLVQNAWLAPEPVMSAAIDAARRKTQQQQLERANQERLGKIAVIESQAQSLISKNTLAPAIERLDPEEVIRARQAEAKREAEAEAKRIADAEAQRLAAENEAKRLREQAELKRLAEEEARRQAERRATETVVEPEPPKTPLHRIILFAMIGTVVLVVVGVVVAIIIQKQRAKTTFKRFFEGRGKLQKDFWAMAEADPDHFKYVAYMFPDLKEANGALQKLSYIRTAPNGDLRSTRDILFGAYPHQEGAVCFVGGVNLHYALWREATAVLPELPNAVYFKVSTEPNVQLEIPDIDKLAADKDIHVENLGVQELAGAHGEFTRCYRYRTDTKKAALDFLESFVVNEEGIVIHVETQEGTWGKDENGIFEV
ncbi:MAG: hypothetical protein BWX73_03292 [Lentisphaerae bacterium ADurb.Bin082]|nr:MAG: hypothetical protein BWX73_03292 [Lentisphaerae bacterium ADurb.Bin082]